jgi:tripeptide aminopeptidase
LMSLLAVPTCSRSEQYMIAFIQEQLEGMGVPFFTDERGSIYATKGSGPGFYPMVCAHTDTVHQIRTRIEVEEGCGILRAYTPDGDSTGCGGDDKAGIFVCLELLRIRPRLKAAFFVSEEIGCIGSSHADLAFGQDVGYCIEFDSPNGDIISYSCDGMQLFDDRGPFAEAVLPVLDAHGMTKWQRHPFTDVAQLRRRFDFECLNLPCGYHDMHSDREYVVLSEVDNAICAGLEIVGAAQGNKYLLESGWRGPKKPARQVTRLMLY